VVVVDNASQDDSLNKIKNYAQGLVKVESGFVEYSSLNKPMKIFEFSQKEYLNSPRYLQMSMMLFLPGKRLSFSKIMKIMVMPRETIWPWILHLNN
jgi:hypothetical protein